MNTTAGTAIARGRPTLREKIAIARQRKTYLVDSKIQFQIVRQFVVVLTVGVALGMANSHVYRLLAHMGLGLAHPGADWVEKTIVFVYVVGLLAVSLTLMFLLCLYYSHRVGGPAMKISAALRSMADGDLWVRIKLRNSDLLQEVADSVNVTASNWRKSLQELEWVVVNLEDSAREDPRVAEQVREIRQIIGRFKTSRYQETPG